MRIRLNIVYLRYQKYGCTDKESAQKKQCSADVGQIRLSITEGITKEECSKSDECQQGDLKRIVQKIPIGCEKKNHAKPQKNRANYRYRNYRLVGPALFGGLNRLLQHFFSLLGTDSTVLDPLVDLLFINHKINLGERDISRSLETNVDILIISQKKSA
jgi:hypothetical protein